MREDKIGCTGYVLLLGIALCTAAIILAALGLAGIVPQNLMLFP